MPTVRTRATPDEKELVDEVVNAYVHRLFPKFRPPAYLACPDARVADACVRAIMQVAEKKGIASEVIDLRSTPAKTLDVVTTQLRDVNDRSPIDSSSPPQLLVLEGFYLLGEQRHDEPTYPFQSKFQFDREHLWLFMGRDWRKLSRLFGSCDLPLYRADGTSHLRRGAQRLCPQDARRNPRRDAANGLGCGPSQASALVGDHTVVSGCCEGRQRLPDAGQQLPTSSNVYKDLAA